MPGQVGLRKHHYEKQKQTKKNLYNPVDHDGVITHLELDILEFKVKWALGSIAMNKASGGMDFQLSYFKS